MIHDQTWRFKADLALAWVTVEVHPDGVSRGFSPHMLKHFLLRWLTLVIDEMSHSVSSWTSLMVLVHSNIQVQARSHGCLCSGDHDTSRLYQERADDISHNMLRYESRASRELYQASNVARLNVFEVHTFALLCPSTGYHWILACMTYIQNKLWTNTISSQSENKSLRYQQYYTTIIIVARCHLTHKIMHLSAA